MAKTSVQLLLISITLTALTVAVALTSAVVASPGAEPPPVSTPSVPEGGGRLLQQWPTAVAQATLTPEAAEAGSLQEPAPLSLTDEHVQILLDAVQAPSWPVRVAEWGDKVADHGISEAWKEIGPEAANGEAAARDLLTHLARVGLPDSASAEPAEPGGGLSVLGTAQLLDNPGFETGSLPPWVAVTSGAITPTLTSATQHAGTWSLHMGNETGSPDVDQALQPIVIPSGTISEAVIEFWVRTETEETYSGYDFHCAVIWNSAGASEYTYCADMATLGSIGWTKVTWTLDADQRQYIAGKSLYFGFLVQNDSSLVSRAWVDDTAFTVTTDDTPTPTPECVELLQNPEMNVVELGDGTGTIEYWSIVRQNVYYDTSGSPASPAYSLVMADEAASSGVDIDVVSSTLDIDEFVQSFVAPTGLTELTVSYSRLYTGTNAGDEAHSLLWTLTDEGYLDELLAMIPIGEDPDGWSSRYWDRTQPDDATFLAEISGRPLAIAFAVLTDRESPSEVIWLDDIQVTACYQRLPRSVYLPAILRNFGTTPGPICVDLEPDSVTTQGHTDVGAVCDGSFGAVDTRDYYALNVPTGVTDVRLGLYDLPSGTNWDALIYEDAAGYPLVCQIGTSGSGDKYQDCIVNPAQTYFVMVNAGAPPQVGQTSYKMSVTQR
jgi:hypothetical protein